MLNVGDQIKTYGAIVKRGNHLRAQACKPVILCDDWDKANLRWEDPAFGFERGIACNVVVTGKAIVCQDGCQWLRGRLEWVQDGDEPSTFEPVLIRVNWDRELELTTSWPGVNPRRIGEVKA